jgi:hypothetical protein
MATTNLMGDQEHDHAARLARFSVEAAAAAQAWPLSMPFSPTLDSIPNIAMQELLSVV